MFEVVYLAVVNNGSLPVRYSLTLNNVTASTSSENTSATADPLQNFQYVIVKQSSSTEITETEAKGYFTQPSSNASTPCAISSSAGGVSSETLSAGASSSAKPTEYYALILYYNSTATTTKDPAKVTLGLRLLAIQNSENVAVNENQAIAAADTDIDPDTQTRFSYTDVTDQPTTTTPETSNSSETSEN